MKDTARSVAVAVVCMLAIAPIAGAHCQIPCGIYGDSMRIDMMREDVETIEKSIRSIRELAGKSAAADLNQMVRWVENKDVHADKIAAIVTEYFLQQRIKAPSADDAEAQKRYADQLRVLHGLLVASMKAKQTVDPEIPGKLRKLIDRLVEVYFDESAMEHMKSHR